jgi:enoyl-CoA hydratase/carnithine racemase
VAVTTENELCLYEVRDGVALVTLNRPERNNGMTGALELAYFARLAQAGSDREARAVVVTGSGRSFCPGADLANKPEPGDEPLPNMKIATTFPLTIDKPLIAAINGGCAGVGLVQALQCDVRFAASQAKFTTAFARRGLIAEYGVACLLPRIVGSAAAADLLVSGRVFDAPEALRIGLVSAVVDRAEVLDLAMGYARDVAANVSPSSMATIKRQLRRYQTASLDEAVADSAELMRQSTSGPDFEEGVASYLEGRAPAFAPLGEGTRFPWMDEKA